MDDDDCVFNLGAAGDCPIPNPVSFSSENNFDDDRTATPAFPTTKLQLEEFPNPSQKENSNSTVLTPLDIVDDSFPTASISGSNDKLLIQIDPIHKESFCSIDFNISSSTAEEEPCISDKWYSFQSPELAGCPFKSLHHAGLEFLHFPLGTSDKRCRRILSGMNDFSSSVCVKLHFIINNLRDCQGIWQQLFLQKLNTILVYADAGVIRAALCKDNFIILKNLMENYSKEMKCPMVFRYWCFFYNVLSKDLVQMLPVELKQQFFLQLQRDFKLASQNSCRCKLDINSCNDSSPDKEHSMLDVEKRMKIIAILIYNLTCKTGKQSTCTNFPRQSLDSETFVKETLVKLFINLYDTHNIHSTAPTNTSEKELENASIMMEIICHLMIGFHATSTEKEIFASSMQLMLDQGCLTSAMAVKDVLVGLFQREFDAVLKGPEARVMFTIPDIQIGFPTIGISGVIKALNNLISLLEYDILTRNEAVSLMDMVLQTQAHLSKNGFWNSDCENVYLHCRHLQCTLEKKLCGAIREIKLDSDPESGIDGIEGILPYSFLSESTSDSSDSSQTSHSRLTRGRARTSTSGIDELYHSYDEWSAGNPNITKLRRAYAHEMEKTQQKKGLFHQIRQWSTGALQCIFPYCASNKINESQN